MSNRTNHQKNNKPFSYSLLYRLFTIVLLICTLAAIDAIAQQSNITIQFVYQNNTPYDTDNNGIEDITSSIDMSVGSSIIPQALNVEKLCTKYGIIPVESSLISMLCYGDDSCCAFLGLAQTKSAWNESLYLTLGMYSASYHNLVDAQLFYVSYNLSELNPAADIYYSEPSNLWANFTSAIAALLAEPQILALGDVALSLYSPQNNSVFASGENIILNISLNKSVNISYSIDGRTQQSLGNITAFSTTLVGQFPNGILNNGVHNVSLFLGGNLSSAIVFFTVNDTTAPKIIVNMTNSSTINSYSQNIALNISLDEYSIISNSFNNQGFTQNAEVFGSTILSLVPLYGQNTLQISAIDAHGNAAHYYYVFTFAQASTCSDSVQNGNEQGIDCGGSCSGCITFTASLDKSSYLVGENIFLNVVSRINSTVAATIKKDGSTVYSHTFVPVFEGVPIAETRVVTGIAATGTYQLEAIMHYRNISEARTATFEVSQPQNQLIVTIGSNATNVEENNPIQFSSAISGAQGSLSYQWDFNNDRSTDTTEANPIYSFGRNGTYTVNLTVTDSSMKSSSTRTITVKKLINTSVWVRDKDSGNNLDLAEVTFEGPRQNTTSDGRTLLTKSVGTYTLRVSKDGYATYSKNIEAHEYQEILVNLTKIDNSPPYIELLNPDDAITIADSNITFSYKAHDSTRMSCQLYTAVKDQGFGSPIYSTSDILSGSEQSYVMPVARSTGYHWYVSCVDAQGNRNSSITRSFTVGEEPALQTLAILEETDNKYLIGQIDDIAHSIASWGTKEQKAADAMTLKQQLERAKINLERADRDIASLVWRRLNDSGLALEKEKISQRVDDIRRTTPRTLIVRDSTEFVSYAEPTGIEFLLNAVIENTNLKIGKKELKKLVEKNIKLQDALIVTTIAQTIDLEYLSGDKDTITLIQKDLRFKTKQESVSLYEAIPKDIVSDLNETVFLFEYEIINADPIIRINHDKYSKFSYYFYKDTDLKSTDKIQSILLYDALKDPSAASFTGLAIFDSFDLVRTADFRLIIEIFIIMLLALVYLLYSFGGIEEIKSRFQGKEIKEITHANDIVQKFIDNKDYQSASLKYKEMLLHYDHLEIKKKTRIKPDIFQTTNRLNLLYIDILAAKAQKLAITDKHQAFLIYNQIQSLYKIIPKDKKALVSKRCLELHSLLAAK